VRLTHEEFQELMNEWSTWWRRLHDQGEPGFTAGPRHLQDWLGSVDAYWRLNKLMGSASVDDTTPREDVIIQ
jgi:hypothetical protein